METAEKLLDLYRKSTDIVPPIFNELFRWLLGTFLVVSLILIIWQVLKRDPFKLLWGKLPTALSALAQEAAKAIEDPIEHRWLTHSSLLGKLAFSCLGFMTFLVWWILIIVLVVLTEPQASGFAMLGMGCFMALQVYCIAYFKAEVGRDLVAYKEWRK